MNLTEQFCKRISPYPPQEAFFAATERRVAYGGARGGGKSYAMRVKLVLLALRYAGMQLLLLRRTYPELRENHINPLRRDLKGIAEYRDSTKEFCFPNGSRIKLGYLQNDADVLQYQGQAYEVIGIEEATQFTEAQYLALTESCRLAGLLREPFVPRMYFTCNPGGVGHAWMKRLFIDRDYRAGEDAADYRFIPAKVYDNRFLMEKNPEYVKTLEALPPLRRKAMLDGDWDVFEGQYFPEFSPDFHVVNPFAVPAHWARFAALDYGLDCTACLWFAYPPEENALIVYREFCESDLILSGAAAALLAAQGEDLPRFIAASPDLAGRRQDCGKGGFEILRGCGLMHLVPADSARIAGWRRVREFLQAKSADSKPFLRIFSTCKTLIASLPRLQFDRHVAEDAALTPHEYTHAPDALRYGLMAAPFLPMGQKQREKARKKTLSEEFFGEHKESYIEFLRRG